LTTDASGTTSLGGNGTTTRDSSFGGNVTLTSAPVTASAGTANFTGTVSGNQALTVNSSGTTTFASTVSAASLTTDANGTTSLGGNDTTTRDASFGDNVTLPSAPVTVSAANDTFSGTVSGNQA